MSIVAFPRKSTTTPKRTTKGRKVGITGRDVYIIAKALGYAIETIGILPDRLQEQSDCEDMRAILAMMPGGLADIVTGNVRAHLSITTRHSHPATRPHPESASTST